ncbi:M20/M25/M40 family metallo-hydrolase [Brucella gallinifaecis]|uniref:M20/M25/M40 family metallo-hydrolase n=1 Tax=Brucella gallinifaecis TaxID=215590 RepID=UPI00236276A5|nr:M20/M25/M40 family metallo-hydrolase [Brucella gallinifaecis]
MSYFIRDTSGRTSVIADIETYFRNNFVDELSALVAVRSESEEPSQHGELVHYLDHLIVPLLRNCGFSTSVETTSAGHPILFADRIEDPSYETILLYGHGDVCAPQAGLWRDGLEPFVLTLDGDRMYGRGTADNKAQHLINLRALSTVIARRPRIGFNVKVLIEMSEEIGSPGLREYCHDNADRLSADVLIASDGPRLRADVPTLFMGSRAAINFELRVHLRDSAYHSGNFGGLLADPALILAHAISSITNERGAIAVPEWRPDSFSETLRQSIAKLPLSADGPPIDYDWGEESLNPLERAFGWNSFAILSMLSGLPESPQNAIAGHAVAVCQLRYVVGTDHTDILPALRRHLDRNGFEAVSIKPMYESTVAATRLRSDHPWVTFVAHSIHATGGLEPDLLPNLAGTIPNDAFVEILNLPTIWIPHSYAGCCQHAPNEHVLASVMLDALRNMTGLFWDIGERGNQTE